MSPDALAAVRGEVAEELPEGVKVIEAHGGELPLNVLLGLDCETELHIDGRKTHHDLEGHEEHDHEAFDSFAVELPEVPEDKLLHVLKSAVIKHGILRIKGFAAVPGKPMRLLLQGVGQRFDKHFDRPWQAGEARVSRLIIIGQSLDPSAIDAELNAALAG